MIFTINKIQVKEGADWADATILSADLAYCTRVSRPAWYKEGNYTNAGIDSLVISFNPSQTLLKNWKVGEEQEVKIVGGAVTLTVTFKVVELTRVSNDKHIIYLMPVVGKPIVESATI